MAREAPEMKCRRSITFPHCAFVATVQKMNILRFIGVASGERCWRSPIRLRLAQDRLVRAKYRNDAYTRRTVPLRLRHLDRIAQAHKDWIRARPSDCALAIRRPLSRTSFGVPRPDRNRRRILPRKTISGSAMPTRVSASSLMALRPACPLSLLLGTRTARRNPAHQRRARILFRRGLTALWRWNRTHLPSALGPVIIIPPTQPAVMPLSTEMHAP